jgi:hypothetical protein
MQAPCFCQCRFLDCVTLLHEYPDGSHDHFPHLPCPDQLPNRIQPDNILKHRPRIERQRLEYRKHKYERKQEMPFPWDTPQETQENSTSDVSP